MILHAVIQTSIGFPSRSDILLPLRYKYLKLKVHICTFNFKYIICNYLFSVFPLLPSCVYITKRDQSILGQLLE